MISTIFSIIGGLFSNANENELTGPEAIVTDYHERQMVVEDGHRTTGVLMSAERLVDQGVFHSNAQAQLWFDLGKYGTYPVTLSLPDGPDEYCELEMFFEQIGMEIHELVDCVENNLELNFVRKGGEWTIDWSNPRVNGPE